MNDACRRLSQIFQADFRQIPGHEFGTATDMGTGVLRAMFLFVVVEPAQIADVVEQRADGAQLKQAFVHDPGAGHLHATVHQPRHGQRHLEDVLDVVIIGFAGMEAGEFTAVEPADVGEHAQQA